MTKVKVSVKSVKMVEFKSSEKPILTKTSLAGRAPLAFETVDENRSVPHVPLLIKWSLDTSKLVGRQWLKSLEVI